MSFCVCDYLFLDCICVRLWVYINVCLCSICKYVFEYFIMSWLTFSQLFSAYSVHVFVYIYFRIFASNIRFYSVKILP